LRRSNGLAHQRTFPRRPSLHEAAKRIRGHHVLFRRRCTASLKFLTKADFATIDRSRRDSKAAGDPFASIGGERDIYPRLILSSVKTSPAAEKSQKYPPSPCRVISCFERMRNAVPTSADAQGALDSVLRDPVRDLACRIRARRLSRSPRSPWSAANWRERSRLREASSCPCMAGITI